MNALKRFFRELFRIRMDGMEQEFAPAHPCDPLRCCTECDRHTMPHRGCMLR